ncbi:MAG: hypothetical protein ABIJ34_07765 [archaeon]
MTIELGGNIILVGFRERDPAELIVLKKIIGNYARKYADNLTGYESLTISLKPIGGEKSKKFEVSAKLLVAGKPIASDVTENNIFVCVSDALKKIEKQAIKN